MPSSRTPRRHFAAPLVMTIAALPAACVMSSKPPPSNQPGPQVREHGTGEDAPRTHTNPPPPDYGMGEQTPEQKAPDYERTWTVTLASDGTCSAMGETTCPANAKCNPPAPSTVACPSGITVARPVQIWASAGETDCYVAIEAAKCPAKATCNPPPPQKTACPQ